MANAAAWFMFLLGIAHIGFGLARYKGPVLDAVSAGFVGKWAMPEVRRTAFWFLIFGPLLMLAGYGWLPLNQAPHQSLLSKDIA